MTPTGTKWLRVSREMPCTVCGKLDWCLISADKTAWICPRTESSKRCGDAGWLHRLVDAPRQREPRRVALPIRTAPPDLTALAVSYKEAATADRLDALATELGVNWTSLAAFGAGLAASYPAWSFPMTDPTTGRVTGIRLRPSVGKKFSVTGSKEALFMPSPLTPTDEALLILEGESDAVAAHGIGFNHAVGRPHCQGGTAHIIALVHLRNPVRVVIVRDNDGPGVRGAEALASTLALYSRDVRVIAPPTGVKDLREWVATGATRRDLEQLIRAADVRRLNFTHKTKGAL